MKLKLIEPLKYLFKDEVRALGKTLGMPDELIWRQPFPGPGLGIRIIGEITRKRLAVLRKVDDILIEEIKAMGIIKNYGSPFRSCCRSKVSGSWETNGLMKILSQSGRSPAKMP